jgi:hypothetical protein
MSIAIKLLESRIEEIESELSKSHNDAVLIAEKNDLLLALRKIQFIDDHQINVASKVVSLPNEKGSGYWSYRLFIDHEVSDKTLWTELEEIDGELAQFGPGDKIIIAK